MAVVAGLQRLFGCSALRGFCRFYGHALLNPNQRRGRVRMQIMLASMGLDLRFLPLDSGVDL